MKVPFSHSPFRSLTVSNDTNQTSEQSFTSWAASLNWSSTLWYLLPTDSHNGPLLRWSPVPDSMLFFHPSRIVKPLASLLPGDSDESFIKATVSCVAHLFFSAFSGSEGAAKLFQDGWSVRRIQRKWKHPYPSPGACDTHGETQMETYAQREHIHSGMHHVYIQSHCSCWVSQALSSLPGPGSVFIVLTNRSSFSYSSPQGRLSSLCQCATTSSTVVRQTIQSKNE